MMANFLFCVRWSYFPRAVPIDWFALLRHVLLIDWFLGGRGRISDWLILFLDGGLGFYGLIPIEFVCCFTFAVTYVCSYACGRGRDHDDDESGVLNEKVCQVNIFMRAVVSSTHVDKCYRSVASNWSCLSRVQHSYSRSFNVVWKS